MTLFSYPLPPPSSLPPSLKTSVGKPQAYSQWKVPGNAHSWELHSLFNYFNICLRRSPMTPARMLSPFANGHEESLRMTRMFLLIMFSDLHIGQSGSYQYTMLLSNMNWIALPKSPNTSVVRASDQCAEVMGLIACVAGARKGKPRASRASRFPQAWVRYLSGTSWSHKRVMLDFKPLPVYVPFRSLIR